MSKDQLWSIAENCEIQFTNYAILLSAWIDSAVEEGNIFQYLLKLRDPKILYFESNLKRSDDTSDKKFSSLNYIYIIYMAILQGIYFYVFIAKLKKKNKNEDKIKRHETLEVECKVIYAV